MIVWDIKARRKIGLLTGHGAPVLSIAITMKNDFIVSGSEDTTVRLWYIHDQKVRNILEGHTAAVSCLAVTSDNLHIVSGSFDKTIRMWSILQKCQVLLVKDNTSSVNCIAISRDSRYITYGLGNPVEQDHALRVLDIKSRQENALNDHSDSILSVALTNDNQSIISGSKDNTVRIWSPSGFKQIEQSVIPLDFKLPGSENMSSIKRVSKIIKKKT